MPEDDEPLVARIAREHLRRGDHLGWFDELYREAAGDPGQVPWANLGPNSALPPWLAAQPAERLRGRALVVGCGLGDDAEALAAAGLATTAFDLSAQAVAWARERFPGSPVAYRSADLLDAPGEWRGAFDLVLEIYTLQALPAATRARAFAPLAGFVAPGGRLLVVTFGRDEDDDAGTLPWPLTRADLRRFDELGLRELRFEDRIDGDEPPRRFRVEYERPA
jgi:SAM-dependent methyltransferase